LLDNRPIT